MRQLALLTLFIIAATTTFAQHTKKEIYDEPSPRAIIATSIAEECLFANKYSKTERRNMYPFKKAVKVMLVSFDESGLIPVKNKIINKQRVAEQAVLDDVQTDSLTSILYNVGYTPVQQKLLSMGQANCYEPRNGILFIDMAGRAFEYIEICFACHRTETSSKKVLEGEYCSTKFNLLRTFFVNAGIRYGTQDISPILSYQEIFKLDTIEVVPEIQNKLNKKTNNGLNLNGLNETELTLFYAINADWVYSGYTGLSGFALFYSNNSANYYSETLVALKNIGAQRLLQALETSAKLWPGAEVPKNIMKRRASLLEIINKVDASWRELNDGLYNSLKMVGGVELTQKENLNALIFDYANLHRTYLID
ncbi:MAG: hypothetical protein V4456_09535 [Bacteroidota bacterium]